MVDHPELINAAQKMFTDRMGPLVGWVHGANESTVRTVCLDVSETGGNKGVGPSGVVHGSARRCNYSRACRDF